MLRQKPQKRIEWPKGRPAIMKRWSASFFQNRCFGPTRKKKGKISPKRRHRLKKWHFCKSVLGSQKYVWRLGGFWCPFSFPKKLVAFGGGQTRAESTHLRWRSPICGFLGFSAKICGFLRFPAHSKCLNFQEKGWICESLRFSAKICVLGFSVTLGPSP